MITSARFVGRKIVHGPLNDIGLSRVVSDLRSEAIKTGAVTGSDIRCSLQFVDKSLNVTYIKKDEGFFESDGESSTKSSSIEEVHKSSSHNTSVEEKIIHDHVFNNNAGSDSEASSGNGSHVFSQTSSKSTSPTSDLQRYRFDHKETYSITDLLICHTDQEFKNTFLWVIRNQKGDLEALVFECYNESEVKAIYRKYLELNKRCKLEKHRRRKSDGGSVVTKSVEALFSRAKNKNSDKVKSVHQIDFERPSLPEHFKQNNQPATQLQKTSFLDDNKSWNLVQHTDRNGITHIEVETSKTKANAEVESSADSMFKVVKVRGQASGATEKAKFARELENILSKELEARNSKEKPEVTKPSKSDEKHHRTKTGEPLSLRQRAPALILSKLDKFEEKASRVWIGSSKADHDSEESESSRNIWSKPKPSKAASFTPPPRQKQYREQWKITEDHESSKSENIKHKVKVRSASPPPNLGSSPSTKGNEKQILIPTKTGKEPVKKLYPKDDSMFLRPVQPNLVQLTPMTFTTSSHQILSAQPHSLPIFHPVQMGSAPIAWARYPTAAPAIPGDDNNNAQHWQMTRMTFMPQAAPLAPQQPVVQSGRGRSRDRGASQEMRRRAQSKSPARARSQNANNLMASTSDVTGITKRFRDFGDAFKQKVMLRRSTGPPIVSNDAPISSTPSNGSALKSNLKNISVNNSPGNNGNHCAMDNKKVHFNKFATVQMME